MLKLEKDAAESSAREGLRGLDVGLLVDLFRVCDALSLCRIRGTCKWLKTVVDGEAELLHIIELGRRGLVQGPANRSLPSKDRSRLLDEYDRAWASQSRFSEFVSLNAADGCLHLCEDQGVLLAIPPGERCARVWSLPSLLHGTGPLMEKSWPLPVALPGTYLGAVLIDATYDLAVLVILAPYAARPELW